MSASRPIPNQPSEPPPSRGTPIRALVTAGGTEEAIDAVRFLGNRSSGRMGCAIADALVARGVDVCLLLGAAKVEISPAKGLSIERFRSADDLLQLMLRELPRSGLVVMSAAVADYRPKVVEAGKLRRTDAGLTLDLEAVPDLLATTRSARKAGARVVGFALEPRAQLEASARSKLERKDLYAIVANPLETLESTEIEGTLFLRDGRVQTPHARVSKAAFAQWLSTHVLEGL